MKLIARKPCSFGGKQFYIGQEVPAELVLSPVQQEKWGVLRIEEGEIAPAAKAEKRVEPPVKKANPKKAEKKPVEEAGEA